MECPTVVRIRRKGGVVVQDCDIYIGRAWTMGGWNLRASIWANPFRIGKDGDRGEVVAKYETYVRSKPELLDQLPTLAGKRLGCFCDTAPCHGHILVKLFAEKEGLPLEEKGKDGEQSVECNSVINESDDECGLDCTIIFNTLELDNIREGKDVKNTPGVEKLKAFLRQNKQKLSGTKRILLERVKSLV